MSCVQRRFGPFNIGVWGILASLINGLNLIINQSFFIQYSFIIIFFALPFVILIFLCVFFIINYSLFLIDLLYVFLFMFILSTLFIILLSLLSFISFNHYSLLSFIRIILSFISFTLVFDILLFVYFFIYFYLSFNFISIYLFSIYNFNLILINFVFLVSFFICILIECNRVPFDINEAESELIAGFMIEYSGIYFSVIILNEYLSIIVFNLLLLLLFNLPFEGFILLVFLVCLIRASLNRIKYDELMILGWYYILIISFSLFLFLIML
jgi:NADH:ubiquinone oxidoreductase subunit H